MVMVLAIVLVVVVIPTVLAQILTTGALVVLTILAIISCFFSESYCLYREGKLSQKAIADAFDVERALVLGAMLVVAWITWAYTRGYWTFGPLINLYKKIGPFIFR